MKNKKLNLVYDLWEGDTPVANGRNFVDKDYKLRSVEGLLNFYGFKNYKRNKLEEIPNNPDENFYYFLNNGQDIFNLIYDLKKLPLSSSVIEYLKKYENFYVVILTEHEYEPEKAFTKVLEKIDEVGLKHKKFYFVNNNARLDDYKIKYNTEMNVHYIRFLPKITARNFLEFESKFVENKEGNLFMCHNRTPKSHRYSLLVLLKKYNILNEFDWSLVMGWEHKNRNLNVTDYQFYRNIFTNNEIDRVLNEINYFNSIDIKKSRFENNHTWFDNIDGHGDIDWNKTYETMSFQHNYINCITESAYFVEDIHITEKSIKPMYFYQLPIFLATQNHVKKLKEIYNFDVFEDLINHDYDDIFDPRERFFRFFNELTRLVRDKNKVIDFYKNNERRLWENKSKAISLFTDKTDYNFFEGLIYKNEKNTNNWM
jgi:hypothetical protein